MKDTFTEVIGENSEKPKAEQYISKPEKKPVSEKKGGRRGVWKKIKVRPADGFETAESQNIRNPFYNSLDRDQKQEKSKDISYEYHETAEEERKNEKVSINEFTDSESSTIPPESTTVVPTKDIESSSEEEMPVLPTEQLYGDLESTEVPESIEVESVPKQEKKSELIEVAKQALTDLFHYASDLDDEDESQTPDEDFDNNEYSTSTTFAPDTLTTTEQPLEEEKPAVKEESTKKDKKLIATSTSTEISHETEICYRGRCIKTDKTKKK